jgi:hypothetical protein
MKEHFCPVEKSMITYQSKCNWCGELESQEPVAWGVDWGKTGDIACVSIIKRLPNDVIELVAVEYAPYSYTTPPQRTWVGLTEDEAFACQGRDYFETYKAIEAKLKEKNT